MMVVKVHCGTVLGTHAHMVANSSPKTVPQCTLTTISAWSLAQPQSGEYTVKLTQLFWSKSDASKSERTEDRTSEHNVAKFNS